MAMDMDVVYNQYGQRAPDERREVRPPSRSRQRRGRLEEALTIGYASAGNGGAEYAGPMDGRCGDQSHGSEAQARSELSASPG